MIWLRLLGGVRPFWQFAILLLYSFFVHQAWQTAIVVIAGATLMATNLTLARGAFHPDWKHVVRIVLLIEALVGCVAAVTCSLAWPFGPAALLLFPTFVTYTWVFEADAAAYWLTLVPCALLLYAWLPTLRNGRLDQALGHNEAIAAALIFAFYLVVIVLGAAMAFLMQRQRREGREFEQVVHTTTEQSAQLERLNRQMTDYANQVYDLAAAEERNRIAGEIHDTVAHRLTALTVQLQAARRFLVIENEDEAAKDAINDAVANLEVCEALAREALEEVRTSVRSIRRPASLEGFDILRRLVRNYGTLTGMDATLDVAPDIPSLPARLLTVLYRVVEESLTNAQRHGRATRVHVALAYMGGLLRVQIDDNGRGTGAVEYGFGLSSMRDRLVQLGGRMEISSTPGSGFSIHIKIPVWEESES